MRTPSAIVTTTRMTNATTKTSKPSVIGMAGPSRAALPAAMRGVIARPSPELCRGPLLAVENSDPALELALDDVADDAHALVAVVEAGQIGESLAAVRLEIVPVLAVELLQRLEAIGREAGRDDREALDAALRQRRHGLVGVGAQPLLVSEARLEAEAEARLRPAEGLAHEAPGLDAVAVVGVALEEVRLRHAVERDQDHLGLE